MSGFNLTPEQFRAKWVEALRSGKYRQGARALAYNDRFCCLGVACEVFIAHGGELAKQIIDDDVHYMGVEGGSSAFLPDEVQVALALRTDDGVLNNDDGSLTYHNDNGATFLEIADLIESGKVALAEAP